MDHGLPVDEVYGPVGVSARHIQSEAEYERMYFESLSEGEKFWGSAATKSLDWSVPFRKVKSDSAWFLGGKLNACFNAVDRWAESDPDRIAVIAEGDEPTNVERLTFGQLRTRVCQTANMLKLEGGVRKGDTVTIYMPTVPDLLITMLACARIGAVHSVVFAGFSAANLRERMMDAQSKVLVCSDVGVRGGKTILLLDIVKEAVNDSGVGRVLVFRHSSEGADLLSHPVYVDATKSSASQRPYCPCEDMDSEDLLFLLYTSGSTGKPKAVAHTTAGYLLYASFSHKYIFDVKPGDVWACVADLGWITGHSYGVYGPLVNGVSTLLFESVPTYPNAGRYWDMVERHRISHFYTAPTAIRTLMKFGDGFVKKFDRSSLKVLGSVGEPINPEAWRWYYSVVGESRCTIMDTYWQTETGGIVLAPLDCRSLKPGSATKPFFGIDPVVLDPISGREVFGTDEVSGCLAFRGSWPGMLRTILGDHQRMTSTYFNEAGLFVTGDGCVRDKDGYFWITGRVDDVIKVSGHRMGSAEIEHALVQHVGVSESAVVGFPHPVKGEGLFCYVVMKDQYMAADDQTAIIGELKLQVRKSIGPVATPDVIILSSGLPKTRSGKIMRRILRKLAHQQPDQLGDLSTLADPAVVDELIRAVAVAFQKL